MASKKPTRKIGAVGVGGAAAIVLAWGLGLAGVDMPAEVAAASGALMSFGLGYLIKERRR